ncbi:HK97-gp10 family putative phage morphogenesis protein [Blautia sp.]|uniref:HK97-gp10 family putative phage morphogenesis protein n=1 Tax=Blautia sp. TaxID=1955243 RepID=UPI00262317AF|nr:HK97-gp10 family putative phage morphogenesis protein [Blautia sp.]
MDNFYEDEGFDALQKLLERYDIKDEMVLEGLEKGAEQFATDIRKLPKPRSEITKAGYTHLLDTVTYKRTKSDIEVGWGKYYGPMVENGTKKMNGSPHIKPGFERNKEKYYKIMTQNIFRR